VVVTPDLDATIRLRAFEFLTEQHRRFGESSLPRAILERGFDFDGARVPLIGPQGIFKPGILPELPLTITTAPPVEHRERPYDDGFVEGGFLRYRYRGTDPGHRDNVGLRLAMQRQTPLVYLHGIVPGLYEAAWPVFIVEDQPQALTFIVAIDDHVVAPAEWQVNDPAALTARRQYITAVVRQRLHQRGFRQRVLRAYQQCCAICRLRHDELLEASHILPDGHPLGEPVVPNGLALCKLHHAAFDSYIIGVTPDLEVTVRLTCWRKSTGRCSCMGCRASRADASTYRAPSISSRIVTSWPNATRCSAAPAESVRVCFARITRRVEPPRTAHRGKATLG
jgi:putative restriction endonuclease